MFVCACVCACVRVYMCACVRVCVCMAASIKCVISRRSHVPGARANYHAVPLRQAFRTREQRISTGVEIPTSNVQCTSPMHETMFIYSRPCSEHA